MHWPEIELANWIAAASALIALLSLVTSILARVDAKRGYRLAVEARDRTLPSLELYIDHGYVRRLVERTQPSVICNFNGAVTK
jgi:hypothetical protein